MSKLTHFKSMFLTFSEGVKMEHWLEIGYSCIGTKYAVSCGFANIYCRNP